MIQVFTFNAFSENTYIVFDDTKEAVIIDPGCYSHHEKQQLTHFIAKQGLKVVGLWNTHCHLDHVFGNPFVVETYGVGLECHEKERPVLERAPIAGDMYGVPCPVQPEPSRWIEAGETLRVGQMSFEVLFTPGHSPGSICFYNAAEKYLIGGDVLFLNSIGRTDLPGGSHAQLLDSIRTQLWPLPDETIVFSGHGSKTSIGYEKKHNPFLN